MKAVSWYFLVYTVLATMASGEHYAVDLLVALPLALAMQAGCERPMRKARAAAAITGASLTLTWILLFRYAGRSLAAESMLTWVLLSLPAILCVFLEWITFEAREREEESVAESAAIPAARSVMGQTSSDDSPGWFG